MSQRSSKSFTSDTSISSLPLIGLVVLTVCSTLLLVFSHISWRQSVYQHTPALDQIMEIKVRLISSHLLFDELSRGYAHIKLTDVRRELLTSKEMADESLKGQSRIGDTLGTLPDDSKLNTQMYELDRALHQLIHKLDYTMSNGNKRPFDDAHNVLFAQAISYAEAADQRIHSLVSKDLEWHKSFFITALALWLAVMALFFTRWRALSIAYKQNSKRLRKLSHAVEHTGESMLISDRNGVIEYVNPAFSRITGYSYEEVLGKNPSLLSSGQQSNEFYKKMWDSILAGNVWRGEVVDKKKDGSLYQAMMSISPMKDDSGEITHFVAVQRDITQIREMEANLLHARKMDAIGTLTCGLAHDMNNSMTAVLGNIELTRMSLPNNEELKEYISHAETAGKHATAMVQELMAFARKDKPILQSIDLVALVKHSIDSMRSACDKTTVHIEAPEHSAYIMGDELQLHRILANLVRNACDALENIDQPKIHLRIEQVDKNQLIQKGLSVDGAQTEDWVCVSVIDNGPGIDPELKKKIFDPFFTTKDIGKGTGLGLSSAYGIMQSHRGYIHLDTKLGNGSTFRLYFPSTSSNQK